MVTDAIPINIKDILLKLPPKPEYWQGRAPRYDLEAATRNLRAGAGTPRLDYPNQGQRETPISRESSYGDPLQVLSSRYKREMQNNLYDRKFNDSRYSGVGSEKRGYSACSGNCYN